MKKWILYIATIFILCSNFVRADCNSTVNPYNQKNLEDASEAHYKGQYVRALALYRPLAEQGNAIAQHQLGWMYDYGEWVTADSKEAVKWYRLAAEQGKSYAQFDLGIRYGGGETKDYVLSHMWLSLAANQGHKEAEEVLKLLTDEMTSSQIVDAQKKVQNCIQKNYKNCE